MYIYAAFIKLPARPDSQFTTIERKKETVKKDSYVELLLLLLFLVHIQTAADLFLFFPLLILVLTLLFLLMLTLMLFLVWFGLVLVGVLLWMYDYVIFLGPVWGLSIWFSIFPAYLQNWALNIEYGDWRLENGEWTLESGEWRI